MFSRIIYLFIFVELCNSQKTFKERKHHAKFRSYWCDFDSWGHPSGGINKTTGAWGIHEQWVYGMGQYLYFENGKLTTIQN